MPKAVCDHCDGVEFEYSLMDIFTHWEFPYVLCPFCGDVVIVKGDINKIYKKKLLWSSLSFKKIEKSFFTEKETEREINRRQKENED